MTTAVTTSWSSGVIVVMFDERLRIVGPPLVPPPPVPEPLTFESPNPVPEPPEPVPVPKPGPVPDRCTLPKPVAPGPATGVAIVESQRPLEAYTARLSAQVDESAVVATSLQATCA